MCNLPPLPFDLWPTPTTLLPCDLPSLPPRPLAYANVVTTRWPALPPLQPFAYTNIATTVWPALPPLQPLAYTNIATTVWPATPAPATFGLHQRRYHRVDLWPTPTSLPPCDLPPLPRDLWPTLTSLPPSDLHFRPRDLWPTQTSLPPCDLHPLPCNVQPTPKSSTSCVLLPNRIFYPNATCSLVHSWFSFIIPRFCSEIAFVVI